MTVFRLTMLPASEGDCLILSYGNTDDRLSHVVVDGGRKATWPSLKSTLTSINTRGEPITLMVMSHIDADHIDGAYEMAAAEDRPVPAPPIWFNGYDQLRRLDKPGTLRPAGLPVADAYSKLLARDGWSVNAAFDGGLVNVEARPDTFEFAGLKITLLSPTLPKLKRLWKEWNDWRDPSAKGSAVLAKRPMPAVLDVEALDTTSKPDGSVPNGSSIGFLAEFGGRRVLLAADAHPDDLLASLSRLAADEGPLAIDLIKLPHHGSRANVTKSWLERVACQRFAVSTNGAVFGHPDPEAISRILKVDPESQKTLYFNYAGERTTPWNDPALRARWRYDCVFPERAGDPLVIDI
ncbi:Metallo-beta-lactamase superfamily protein [compost metagenome]